MQEVSDSAGADRNRAHLRYGTNPVNGLHVVIGEPQEGHGEEEALGDGLVLVNLSKHEWRQELRRTREGEKCR